MCFQWAIQVRWEFLRAITNIRREFKMKLKRKIIAVFTCVALVCSMGLSASALSYDLDMKEPDPSGNRIRYTSSYNATSSPYVKPNVYATPTDYYLVLPDRDGYNVSQVIYEVSNTVRRNFTYYDGYGGSGEKYRMGAAPSYSNYYRYRVTGSWSP